MDKKAEIKRAILKGVLEDNLDLPNLRGRGRQRSGDRPSAASRALPRSRWSTVPALLAFFLLASGAAFPRLAGVMESPQLSAPVGPVPAGELEARKEIHLDDSEATAQSGARSGKGSVEKTPAVTAVKAIEAPLPVLHHSVFASTDLGLAEARLPALAHFDRGGMLSDSGNAVHTLYAEMIGDGSVPVADLFGLKVSTIVIDPGHGGIDPGTTGPNGVTEKELTLDIALRLRDKLQRAGNHRVLLTREQDIKVPLKDRVEFARENKADLFISIHFNALPVESKNLVETFYFGPHSDKRILELAEKENAGSGYGIGSFRRVIERISDTLKTQESEALARFLQNNLYAKMKRENPGLINAGIKTAPFVVLLGSDVPSVLAEVSCLSNEAEARNLENLEYRERIAGFLMDGVIDYLDQQPQPNENLIVKGELRHVAKQQDR